MWANCFPLLSLSLHDMWKVLLGRYLNLYKCSGYLANVPLSQKCDGLSEWGQKLCHTTLPLMSFQPTPPQPPTLHLSWHSNIISTTIQATRMVSVGWMSSTVNHFQPIRRLSHRSKSKHGWKIPLWEKLLLKTATDRMQMTTPWPVTIPTRSCGLCCGEKKRQLTSGYLWPPAYLSDCRAGKCSNLSEILSRPQLFAKVTVTTDCRCRARLHLRDSWNAGSVFRLRWGFTCTSTAVSWSGRLSSPKLSVQPHNWSTQSAVPVNPTPILGTGFWGRGSPSSGPQPVVQLLGRPWVPKRPPRACSCCQCGQWSPFNCFTITLYAK